MVNILRRWNQPIMVVITVLVIVSFVYWGPNIGRQDPANRTLAKLYGQEIKLDDWKRVGRRVGIYAQLGGTYIRTIFPGYQPYLPDPMERLEAGEYSEIVARSIVLDRECTALGITSTEAERLAILNSLTRMQGADRTFEPRNLQAMKERWLTPNGFTENDFDRIFLDGEVRAKKLRDLIGETTTPLPAEIKEMLAQSEMQVDASYVAFKHTELRKDLKVTEEEVKKAYEADKAQFKTPEYRKVRYAAFLLVQPADGKALPKEQRTAQLQKLATSAYDLAQQLKKPGANFDELAKAAGATVDETKEFFPANDAPGEFDENPEIAKAAFTLTKEQPYSSHLSVNLKGSYVLQLKEIKEPEQRTLEQAKTEIEAKLLEGKAKDLALAKAKEAQPKLAEAIKGGKKFAEAAQALNLKVEEFPSFTGGRYRGLYDQTVGTATPKLAAGQISEALADSSTGDALIVHLDSRGAADEKKLGTQLPMVTERLTEDLREVVFRGWLKERELAAGMATAFAREPEQ